MLGSLTVMAAGFALMGFTLSPASTQSQVALKMTLLGLGLGPSFPLYALAIQHAVPARQVGVATSTAMFFRQLGATVGLAVLGTVFAAVLSGGGPPRAEDVKESFTHAFEVVHQLCTLITLAAFGLTLLMPEVPLRRTREPPP
jgi:MFS family permease